MSHPERISHLFRQYFSGAGSAAETEELLQLVYDGRHDDAFRKLINEQMELFNEEGLQPEKKAEDILATILQNAKSAPVKSMGIWRPLKYAAAVVLLALSTLGGYFIYQSAFQKKSGERLAVNDAAPGRNKATLTLADGGIIELGDGLRKGFLTEQDNARVINLADGKLAYEPKNKKQPTAVSYNSLATPKGGQYQLTLSDGSNVWLNAASSIHFPSAFLGNERRVEVTGEAYFEVSKDPTRPFIVSIASVTKGDPAAEIQVLGTHFNINAYNDRAPQAVTLLEGSVNVRSRGQQMILRPSQQALVGASGELQLNDHPDIEEVIAWKNGMFYFTNADIRNILTQISRWYDVDVIFEGNFRDRSFSGKIDRNVNLSGVLRILELSDVHFRIEGKKLFILSE